MATVYTSKDAGLPAFYTSSTASLARFTNYKLLLKGCLVTGYGAKPSAGWTLVDEGDMFLVLRNGSGNYVTVSSGYNFNTAGLGTHGVIRIYLHASYTGISGGVPQGLGVVSGQASGNSSPHHFGTDLFYWTANARWVVVADGRTFIFVMLPITSSASTVTAAAIDSVSGAGTLYVGDDLAGNFIAAGGLLTNTINAAGQQASYFGSSEITTLRNPKTGLLVDTGGIVAELEGAVNRTNTVASVNSNAGVNLLTVREVTTLEMAQVRWYAANQTQAGLRGIRRETMLLRLHAGALRNSLEASTVNYTGDTIITPPAVLPDEYRYLPLMASIFGRCAMIITDNPSYW